MDGTGHRMFAGVFTGCTSLLLLKTDLFSQISTSDIGVTAATMALVGMTSSSWPDGDLLAMKPTEIITGTAKQRFSKKYNREYYYVGLSPRKFKKKYGVPLDANHLPSSFKNKKYEMAKRGIYMYYEHCRMENPIMLAWSFLFKAMKIKKHRGWQSHSPALWIPVWIALIYGSAILPTVMSTWGFLALVLVIFGIIFVELTKKKKIQMSGLVAVYGAIAVILIYQLMPFISKYFPLIIAALGLGYISHIVGDMFTQEGAPILADNKFTRALQKIPILGRLVVFEAKPVNFRIGRFKFKLNFAKASNKWYPYLLMGLVISITFAILDPHQALITFKTITLALFSVFKILLGLIGKLFLGLYNLLKG